MNPNNVKSTKVQTKKNFEKKSTSTFVTCRSGIFYGLTYRDVVSNELNTSSGLVATPNFVFMDNQSKVFIDFSDYKNSEETPQQFKDFWNLAEPGSTFTVSSAELYDSNANKKYDVSGTYEIIEIRKEMIHASVISVIKIDSNLDIYSKQNFKYTPVFQITTNASLTNEPNTTVIVNKFGIDSKNSFSFLGTVIGDKIKIQNNDKAYEVLDYKIDSIGREILKIKGEIEDEDRNLAKTLIQVLVKVNPNVEFPKIVLEDEVIGSCKYTDGDGVLKCYDKQTASQCNCRKEKTNSIVEFSANTNCEGQFLYNKKTNTIISTTQSTQPSEVVLSRLVKDISKKISTFQNVPKGKIF